MCHLLEAVRRHVAKVALEDAKRGALPVQLFRGYLQPHFSPQETRVRGLAVPCSRPQAGEEAVARLEPAECPAGAPGPCSACLVIYTSASRCSLLN